MKVLIGHFREKDLQRSRDPAAFMKDAICSMGFTALLVMGAFAAAVIFTGERYALLLANFMHLVLMGAMGAFLRDYFTGLWYVVRENISFADKRAENRVMTVTAIGFVVAAAAVFVAVWAFVHTVSGGMVLSPAGMMVLFSRTGGIHYV